MEKLVEAPSFFDKTLLTFFHKTDNNTNSEKYLPLHETRTRRFIT